MKKLRKNERERKKLVTLACERSENVRVNS